MDVARADNRTQHTTHEHAEPRPAPAPPTGRYKLGYGTKPTQHQEVEVISGATGLKMYTASAARRH